MMSNSDDEIYHPLYADNPREWLLCHVSLGAKNYVELGSPKQFNEEIAPKWYKELNEGALEETWNSQELYLEKLLGWIAKLGITDAFISGAEQQRERSLLGELQIPSNGHFKWQERLTKIIPSLNFHNLYLRAQDGSELIVYESDTATVFVKDKNGTLPSHLKKPQLSNINSSE